MQIGDQIVVCFWLLHQIQMCPDNFTGVVYDQIQQCCERSKNDLVQDDNYDFVEAMVNCDALEGITDFGAI